MTSRTSCRYLVLAIVLAARSLYSAAISNADQTVSIRFQESYAGIHQAEFSDLLSQVKTILPAALAYITGQWGLPNTLHSPLTVTITDVPSANAGRPLAAYVRSVRYGNELRQVLVVDLQHHLLYPGENIDNLLYHEMAHAILQDAVAGPTAAGIPQWFNEGLAQSVTTEGRDRTADDYKQWGHSDARAVICDLNGNVDAFYHGEYNFGCYTQYYLAVQRLIVLGGKDTVVKIIAALHAGAPLPEVVQQVASLDWVGLQSDIQQYTRDIFAGNKPIP